MSGVAIIRSVMLAANVVTDIVGTKAYAGVVPQATVLPALAINEISAVESHTVSKKEDTVLITERVQVTVLEKTYQAKETLIAAVRQAGRPQSRLIAGYQVRSILRDITGPDMDDDDKKIFVKTQDFIVKYLRQNI